MNEQVMLDCVQPSDLALLNPLVLFAAGMVFALMLGIPAGLYLRAQLRHNADNRAIWDAHVATLNRPKVK